MKKNQKKTNKLNDISTLLTGGEYVVNKSVVDRYGNKLLDKINKKEINVYIFVDSKNFKTIAKLAIQLNKQGMSISVKGGLDKQMSNKLSIV